MVRRPNQWAAAASVMALAVCFGVAAVVDLPAVGSGARPVLGSEVFAGAAVPEPGARPGYPPAGWSPALGRRPDDPTPPPRPPDGARPADPTGTGPSDPGDAPHLVRFVYFVEQDQEPDPAAVELIADQAAALQRFWYDQFGGTFTVADTVEVIYGDHPAEWYDTTPVGDDPRWYRLTNIRDEIERHLGLDGADGATRYVAYPHARIDGRVGAYRYRGAVMDGDDIACITGAVTTTPYSPDFPADCLTTVAHELGHVFGLGHQGPDEDCMQFGFYLYLAADEACRFSAPNRLAVIDDPSNAGWLGARPGDRAPAG